MHERLPASHLERSPSTTSGSDDEEIPQAIEVNAVVRRYSHDEASSDGEEEEAAAAASRKTEESAAEQEVEFLYEQDFYAIREDCIKRGVLFEDPEFPADNDLLRCRTKRVEDDVEWMRPSEFLRPSDPVFVSDRNEGFDVKPTLDSWFVPAMSAVAESESLLARVVPTDQGFTDDSKYAGIFHFRFWFGRWIEIVVDDRIPVRKNAPIYMRSSSAVEMWPVLLEKAYAKAKGSYELLNHWLPIDGCIELTGGVPERIRNLPELLSEEAAAASNRVFFDLIRSSQLGNVILASMPLPPKQRTVEGAATRARLAEAEQLGLEVRYVYQVTQVANLGGRGRQVVRVKNCSGPKPVRWLGAWNPQDTRWTNVDEKLRRKLDSEAIHDGGFWMAYEDFLKYFQTLDICHINADVDQDVTFHGRWEKGLNAGGVQRGDFKNFSKNPQCFIRLNDPDPHDPEGRSSAIVSLMQRRQPQSRAKGMNKIGFKIFRVDDSTEELNAPFFMYRRNDGGHKCVAKTPTWQDGRETNIRARLPKGKYCIIPCTFAAGEEGDFILRVHIERYSRELLRDDGEEEIGQIKMVDEDM